MNSPLLRRLMSALVALLLLFYIGYQVYTANYKIVQTETVSYDSTSDTIQVEGVAIRKESVITSKLNGEIDYVLNDGGKVAKDGAVARVYSDSQGAAAQQQLQNLDNSIAKLQSLSSPGGTYAADIESISREINQKLTELLGRVNSCEYEGLPGSREDLLYLVNERQVVTGKTVNFNSRINELKAQRSTLAANGAKATGTIQSPVPGYFIRTVDGLESVYDYSRAMSLRPKEFREKQSIAPNIPSGAVGKVCTEYNWYFAFLIKTSQASEFKLGDKVSIRYPFASSDAVTATVAGVNQEPKESEAVVVLQSDRMNSSIASIRNATAQVQTQSYTGIRVSQKAVHFLPVKKTVKDKNGKSTIVTKEVKGVFVMHGSEIKFKQIFPLFSTESYVICEANPPAEDLMTDKTVQLSDEVVVEGTGLFDGKVIK